MCTQAGFGDHHPTAPWHTDAMGEPEKPTPAEPAEIRDAAGRFRPGNSANPGGRSKVQRAVQAILDEAAPTGAGELVRLMTACEKESDRIAAIKLVLEHAIGKPKERDDDGEPIANEVIAALLARRPP